ncbi:uncharacterized protein BCN122_I0700 [Burkholderia cenocepacia]|nr:uncharacterized protein BCN122_I0700 [Burkholderia cenocepacia]
MTTQAQTGRLHADDAIRAVPRQRPARTIHGSHEKSRPCGRLD